MIFVLCIMSLKVLFSIFRYVITGNNLGETKIVFSSGSGDMLVSSEPINVQVSCGLDVFIYLFLNLNLFLGEHIW